MVISDAEPFINYRAHAELSAISAGHGVGDETAVHFGGRFAVQSVSPKHKLACLPPCLHICIMLHNQQKSTEASVDVYCLCVRWRQQCVADYLRRAMINANQLRRHWGNRLVRTAHKPTYQLRMIHRAFVYIL